MQPSITIFNKILIVYHRFPPIAHDLRKAFLRLGIQAEIYYTTDYEHWFYHRVIRKLNRLARNFRLIPKGGDLFVNHRLNLTNYVTHNFEKAFAASKPDGLFVIHGLPFGVSSLKNISIPKIGWHLEPRDDLPYLIENASAFDIYNSYSQKDVDLLVEAGYDCRYLAHAVDPENFYSTPAATKEFDVTFVGNWSPWRDEVVKAALNVTPNIALYGAYWKKKSFIPKKTLRRIHKGEIIIGSGLNRLFNASKIVLNASRIRGSSGLNMRFFEVPASGSLLLTDSVPELEKHFVPNTQLAIYRDINELHQQLTELLNDSQKRDAIRHAGQHLVLSNHHYDAMAKHLLNQFEEILAHNFFSGKMPKIKPPSYPTEYETGHS